MRPAMKPTTGISRFSWIHAAARLGIHLRVACPVGYEPNREILAEAQKNGEGEVEILHDPAAAAAGADALYTDVWTSMGQEAESQARRSAFEGYQVNTSLLAKAKSDALVMHCLPAHRGEEITGEVVDGPQSVVIDQAENRLHAQKAVMIRLAESSAPTSEGS